MASGPTITAKFLADTSKLTSEVDSATGKAGSSMSTFAKNAAVALGGAFVADKVLDFGKASVESAAADAEAQASLAKALKNTTGATDAQIAATEDYISNLSKQTALADDDLRPAMQKLALGFGDAEEAQKALTIATDVSAGTGKDLATVTDAMMKAAQGNTGALKKMGVEVKNADGSAKSLDQIMFEMSKTFRGQAETAAGSTAGQMRAAEIAMGELQETIGTALLPIIAKLATFMTDTLLPALEASFGWIMDNKAVIIAALIAVGAVLLPMFVSWAIAAGTAAIATLAAAAPLIAIGAAVAAVAYLIISNWDTIKAVTIAVWDAIVGAVQFVWNWIADNWPLLLAILTGPFGIAVKLIVDNWDAIKGAAEAVWRWLQSAWQSVLGFITGPLNAARDAAAAVWDAIKGAAKAVWDWLSNTWSSVTGFITGPINSAKDVVLGAWTAIKDGVTGVYDWIKSKFEAIAGVISGVVSAVSRAVSSVVNAIKAPINGVIDMWNKIEFGIPSFTLPTFDTHIPGIGKIGGQTFGGATIKFPDIPKLAAGGVLTSPTLFLGGEAGTEIVAPEAMLRQIMREEGGGGYTLNIFPRTADAADVAYGFRRLELMAGAT